MKKNIEQIYKNDTQYMTGREQYQIDAFGAGAAVAAQFADKYRDPAYQADMFFKGYVDAHLERIQPVLENA